MKAVAVIIPYYQKRPGILRRALRSVLQQRLAPDIRVNVLVVDDGSPARADPDVAPLVFETPFSLTIIRQPNGGVAAARNSGLRHVDEATTYIAFLDSDDVWEPNHLGSALAALDQGFDLYFCNSQRDGSRQTRFSEFAFGDFLTTHAEQLAGGLFELECKPFFDTALELRPFQTPTAVYRRAVAPELAFDRSLRVTGEDCLFFYHLIQKCRRICCRTELMVRCGTDGVNIFASKFSWNDPGHLIRHMGQLLACYRFREELSLSPENRRTLAAKINKVRAAFAFFTLRYFLKKREAWPQELCRMVLTDRRFLVWYPFYILYVAACVPLRLYDPLK
jgi:succinoglycan biosynthesis protein ExoW